MYLCTARETLSTEGEVRFLSVLCSRTNERSKILERRRCLSLSQSAPLGRLDCNGSSQSKRDLLTTAGEPALTTRRTHFARRTVRAASVGDTVTDGTLAFILRQPAVKRGSESTAELSGGDVVLLEGHLPYCKASSIQ